MLIPTVPLLFQQLIEVRSTYNKRYLSIHNVFSFLQFSVFLPTAQCQGFMQADPPRLQYLAATRSKEAKARQERLGSFEVL